MGVGEIGAGLWRALRFLKFIIFEINLELSLVFCTYWIFWQRCIIVTLTFGMMGRWLYAQYFRGGVILTYLIKDSIFYQRISSACTIFIRRVSRAVSHC